MSKPERLSSSKAKTALQKDASAVGDATGAHGDARGQTAKPSVFERVLDAPMFAPLAAIASHLTALGCGFIWHDHGDIERGLALAPAGEWLALFTRGFSHTGFYRPVVALTLSLDALVGSPAWFHATNIVLHALATYMVLLAAEAMGLSRRAASFAALLFAVHPLTTIVTGSISYRSEAMLVAALAGLLTAHLRGHVLLAGVTMVLGALSKETALALAPLFVAAVEVGARLPGRTTEPHAPIARLKVLFLAEATALAVAVSLRAAFAPHWRATGPSLALADAVGTRLAAMAKNAVTLVVPVSDRMCDAFPVTSVARPSSLAGALVLVLVGALAWKRRGPALLLALSLVPALSVVPLPRFWSPHYLYLPLAFAAMLVGERVVRRQSWWRAGVAMCALLGAMAFERTAHYASDDVLWGPEVAAVPECREGQFYLGHAAQKRRAWAEAGRRYELAAEPPRDFVAYTDRAGALQNLGVVRLEQGQFSDAAHAFEAALEATGDEDTRRELTHNLATAELRAGNPAQAARLLESEVARQDAFPESIALLARALHMLGRDFEAAALIGRLTRMRPPSSR